MHAGILIFESDILISESRKAQLGESHYSYLSILVHHLNIVQCTQKVYQKVKPKKKQNHIN